MSDDDDSDDEDTIDLDATESPELQVRLLITTFANC